LRGAAAASVSLARLLEEGREVSDEVCHRLEAIVQSIRSGWFSNVSVTPINGDIGPNRRVAWIETDLDEVKRIKNALGGTVNDVVIAVIAGALRRFFTEDRAVTIDGGDIRAMVPVSLRDERSRGQLVGNQITMWLIDLPVAEPDPAARLESIVASTTRSKEGDEALGAAMLTQTVSWTPGTLLAVAARVAASTLRPFNLTITNVPGPQIPLYLLGAPMVANYPMVPLWASHGVGFALFSYAGKIDWGLASDFDLVPDVDRLAEQIRAELDALLALADAAVPTDPASDAVPPLGAEE
jgi:WS/DGAT/MGAT family acyltransferase